MKKLILALAICVSLTACNNKSADNADTQPKQEDKQVFVYNWSDYIAEDTLANFEKETGIKVVYDVYDSNETLEAKLLAGSSGYDVVFPSARPFAEKQVQAGIFADLNKAELSNWKHNDAVILKSLSAIDQGNAKLVPYMWGTTGIGYNVKKVREILGPDAQLDSWSMIFDPAIAGKLAQCGIAVLDDPEDSFTSALLWKGMNPTVSDQASLEAIKSAYMATRQNIKYFNSSKYISDLASGDICVAMGYSGDVFQARDRADEAKNGVEIEFIIPKEGASRWVDVMAIPKDAPHPSNATKFINYLMKPEVAAGISNYVWYATPNTEAKKLLDPELAADQSVYPSSEVEAKLVDSPAFPQDIQRQRTRLWTTIKTGQ
ncbi:MAG TPA: polyamine ABC transporter substrate-binding protein [Arenimonas sp.]|nr:polyamine ABC transporter substrate-binding protein [Arenimonas sp.]